ncbi:glycine-rich domain-containing protein [Ovoidimarina sediminis]|uniref:glycine-rich domain-containing protein n=1 Tax=Ovoidimarina sediminis TaxID=3079856 RepID=UPI0029124A71|nr:hypothetical protein [Rhodophyticola sp. MJ-SS7]MDU8942889.1 hypothetical protein [Rhodophyticola sp. MJ-SS7]
MRDAALWSRISTYAFPLEPAGRFFNRTPDRPALQARLEERENWAEDYASEAVGEYRRFLYLTAVSPGEVTPSEVIDRVWHEHIWDTQDYLDGFCEPVLGRVLHHRPSTGSGDRERHARQYDATRALYEEEFGAPPPPDIWQYREPAQKARDVARGTLAFILGLVVGAGTAWTLWTVFGWRIGAVFWGFAAGGITSHIVAPKVPGPRYRSSDSDGGAGCGD